MGDRAFHTAGSASLRRTRGSVPRIEGFDLGPGDVLIDKYEVVGRLGQGWEGEVYLVSEIGTGIERAAKFFFPHRNPRNRTLRYYAKKLHRLRHCPILIQYHTQETIDYEGIPVTFVVSEYVEGEPLSEFLKRQPGKRLDPFQAFHLLHALAAGMESIHNLREYHGDLHTDNIIVRRAGLGFDVKLLDLYRWKAPRRVNIQDDVCDLVRVFYEAVGGRERYARQPQEVKGICCGLRRSLILKKFNTAGQLRQKLETMQWESR
ncbi:MAG: protein kinase [Candidatus Eisenbacteria bacterium]|nr:protein kinase [Candidatus Eisenbacteria bacterium]